METEKTRLRVDRLRGALGSVRVRTSLGAVVVLGVALIVAAIAMVVLLRRSLVADIKRTARVQAVAVDDVLSTRTADEPIRVVDPEEEFVQVIDSSGKVVASSSNVSGQPPLVDLKFGESARLNVPFEEDPFLAVAFEGEDSNTQTILVGRTMETIVEATETVVRLLLAGLPLLLIVVAAVLWKVVGKALAPVESIRTEVESISGAELHRRVPEPDSNDEIARLAFTMNQMLTRLDESQSRQRRFVSDASHELRSPVATIRQHAEVALAHPDTASPEDLARTVLAENLRLQRLVEDLLLLARMDEHAGDGRNEAVDLDDVVFEEIKRLPPMTDKRVDARGVSAGRVIGDRKRLGRVVANLLDNAARHARSTVVVSLAEKGEEVTLVVEDDGKGIPPNERDRVVERFVRLQESRDRDTGGSGLGLAIVAEVAAAHGGAVRILASSSGGARIEVVFPRAAE